MKVRSLKLFDHDFGDQWEREIEDHWNYEDFLADRDWRTKWISMDCALYNADDDRVYLGITSFDADIFKAFDRRSGKFLDLGYKAIADPYDSKFHRALVRSRDGCIYAAIALLHEVDSYYKAPGSAIVRFDPRSGELSKIGIPLPHVYVQAMVIDNERDRLYCQCFAPEHLVSFDLKTRQSRDLGQLSMGGMLAQGETLALDDAGCVWFNWGAIRGWQSAPGVDALRIAKYDPRCDRITYFKTGLPKPDGTYGTEKCEAWFNFHDGFMYASGANGSLYRVDTETGRAEYLFTPVKDRRSRLTSLVRVSNDLAYGVAGRDGHCELLEVNYRRGTFKLLGGIRDGDGKNLWQCHDIVRAADGMLYVCENDNPRRSSYLWEIEV